MTRDAVRRRGVLLGAPLYPEVLTNQGVAVNLQVQQHCCSPDNVPPLLPCFADACAHQWFADARSDVVC